MKTYRYLMTTASFLALSMSGIQTLAQIDASLLPPVPAGVDEDAIWAKYCQGDRRSPARPEVNYATPEVVEAARKLATVSNYSFYFYSGPMRAYGLRKAGALSDVPESFPKDIEESFQDGKKNAHAFLLQTCGEFRDRPTMIREKVNWARRIHLLPDTPQQPIDLDKDLWLQVSAHSYGPYIRMSSQIWNRKKSDLINNKTNLVELGSAGKVDTPVDGFTVCETKYIFKNYIEKGQTLGDWDEYKSGLAKFDAELCKDDDRNHYYDFRGDSNAKHYSPESNGMIWFSSSITPKCDYDEATKNYKSKQDFGGVDICNLYFTQPFAYRWAAARAGLASWLFRARDLDQRFQDQYTSITIVPNLTPQKGPFTFRLRGEAVSTPAFEGTWSTGLNLFWNQADMGFNTLMGLGSDLSADLGFAYQRLRDSVNRHTNWYQSGYDDGMGLTRDQAYSPFVASSYEMSQSDSFTAPGTTVNAPRDGCKHWMFVFKIKKENWYNTSSLKAGEPIDFNRHWLDETSFGTDHLAKAEHAWDRLGSALEGEFDTMLYLHNISDYGTVNAQCWKKDQ